MFLSFEVQGVGNHLPDSTFHGVFLLEKVLRRVKNLTPYLKCHRAAGVARAAGERQRILQQGKRSFLVLYRSR